MLPLKITALSVMAIFYISYFTKMIMQHRKGVKTDQIAKGNKRKTLLIVEVLMKIATYSIVLVEVISIIGSLHRKNTVIYWIGIVVAFVGVSVFIIAMITMRDSWRAGIPEKDKTSLVTTGIYRFSRNPAFLGFDLMYIGLLIAFFNIVHLLFAAFAITLLHLQILQEEKFLASVFGESYIRYKNKTARYFII